MVLKKWVRKLKLNGPVGKINLLCIWITKLAFVNILWLLFSIIGFIFLGVFPASAAMFTIIRKWLMKENDFPIFLTYVSTYKNEFIKSNILGFLFIIFGGFLYIDFRLITSFGGTLQYIFSIPLFMISIFYLITLLYIFPVYVHFDMKLIQYIKNSFYFGFLNIHITILMFVAIALLMIVFKYIPGLAPFFSIILISLITMYGASYSFRRMERKHNKPISPN